MKFKKIMLVMLILLAILTIGAVSASESSDTLAAENDVGGDLAVDESPSETEPLGDPQTPSVEDVSFEVNDDDTFNHTDDRTTRPEEDNKDNCPIKVNGVPDNNNGRIVISVGESERFNKSTDGSAGSMTRNEYQYWLSPLDLNLTEADHGCILKASFYNDGNQIISSFYAINFIDSTYFNLQSVYNVENRYNWEILYSDCDENVISIDVSNQEMNGIFYVTANGREYKYLPNFNTDGGHAWHGWELGSFDITDENEYPFTVEYSADDSSPREVIFRGILNVTEFRYDTFRITADNYNMCINVFCPDNHEGNVTIVVRRQATDESSEPLTNYPIQGDGTGKLYSWRFSYLGCLNDEDYDFSVTITNDTGEVLSLNKGLWVGMPWERQITSEVSMDIYEASYEDYSTDDVLGIFLPEKSQVYNGTLEVKYGENNILTKHITTRDMDFEDGSRHYRYGLSFAELKENLGILNENVLLTFIFKYDDTQIFEPFFMINFNEEDDYDFSRAYNLWVWNDEDGPLYTDYDHNILDIKVQSQALAGIFYVTCNNTEYKFLIAFSEDENGDLMDPYHSWLLSSFGIDDEGLYPFTIEYADDDSSPRFSVLSGTLNVTEFKYDTFRATDDKANGTISVYCPNGAEGTVLFELKHDEDVPYETVKTVEITPELNDKCISFSYSDLGFKTDCDNLLRIRVLNGTDEIFSSREFNIWYDPEWEPSTPRNFSLSVNDNEFREDDDDSINGAVVELYVPEDTFIYGGTIEIKSGEATIFSEVISTRNMDFDDDGRYYSYCIIYKNLNLENVKDCAVLTCTFTYDENNPKNISKSFIYRLYTNEDDADDKWATFRLINFMDANVLRDENVIEIADFPDGVDDEFTIFVTRWEDSFNATFKISELARNEYGIYTFNCTALGIDKLMENDSECDIELRIQFYKNDEDAEEYSDYPIVFKNPDMFFGEVDEDYDGDVILFRVDMDDLSEVFDDEFTVNVTYNGNTNQMTFRFSQMDNYRHEYDDGYVDYFLTLKDLGITGDSIRGEYNLTMEFTKKGTNEKVCYSSTINVVDFVIEARSKMEVINDAVFRIRLNEDDSGRVVILINGTPAFNKTLEEIGYHEWNRMGNYPIFLNDLQINESGNYPLELQVYDDNGNLLRTINHTIGVAVGENTITFSDLVYQFSAADLIVVQFTKPIPTGSELVLYLNGQKAGTARIDDDFEFVIDESFLDGFGWLKPGSYDARVELVSNGVVINSTIAEASFRILSQNGTTFSIPATVLATNDVYLSFKVPVPDSSYEDQAMLFIYIDPYMTDDGRDCSDENTIGMGYDELKEFWDGTTHKIDLGRLSVGSHKILVTYVFGSRHDIDGHMSVEFFSNFFTVNVQKVTTQLVPASATVTATYNVAKNIVVTLKANGKILAGKKVTVKVGTISKTLWTDKYGKIYLDISKLAPKNYYTAYIKFAGDNLYKASSKQVKVVVKKAKTKLVAKKVKVKVNVKKKKVAVTLKDQKGRVLKNKKVFLTVKGVTYKVNTNKKGVALFKVKNLKYKGTYKANVKFKGNNYYLKSSTKVKIIVK